MLRTVGARSKISHKIKTFLEKTKRDFFNWIFTQTPSNFVRTVFGLYVTLKVYNSLKFFVKCQGKMQK